MMIPMMHYNLLSNAATVARKGAVAVICSKPGCKYDELVFIPFEPKLELGAFLVWKDNQRFSKAATAFIEYIKKYKKCMD